MKKFKLEKFLLLLICTATLIMFGSCGLKNEAGDSIAVNKETSLTKNSESSEESTTTENTESSEESKAENSYDVPADFALNKNDIQHGELKLVTYDSSFTGRTRKCYVYTPPGYTEDQKYPILYLLHGIGGTESEWFNGGSPNDILDNLYAAGEITPMVVVFPNVRASTVDSDNCPSDAFGTANVTAFDNFIFDLEDCLMPFIRANYSVYEDREHQAIAGLSMGGRESLYIGFKKSYTFSYIGAFSPAPGLNTSVLKVDDEQYTPKLVMICTGDKDNVVYENPKNYSSVLETNNVDHIFYVTSGGHDFTVWKNGLYNFSKLIFK